MWFSKKKSKNRRRYFLLDSNQTSRNKPKLLRNKGLQALSKFLFFKNTVQAFSFSLWWKLTLLGMAGFIIFAIFSPYFELKKITVIRDNPHLNIEKVEHSLEAFYGKNLLFINKQKISETLLDVFPEFRSVNINEIWPSSIQIQITLSPPFFTVRNDFDASFSVVSRDGIILSEKPRKDLLLVKIIDFDRKLIPGNMFLEESQIQSIVKAKDEFEKKFEIKIKELRLFPYAQELHIVSNRDISFWLDLQRPITEQTQVLEWGAGRIGLYTKFIEHVDLRIPNRIFWKPKK